MAIRNENTHQQLRLATQIARLYHEQNRTQPEIAQLLSITQTRVSRMLKFAAQNGIIRTTVHVPPGIFSDIEDELQQKFGGIEFVVVDAAHLTDDNVTRALASSAAAYLEMAIPSCEIIGVSSWSETLLKAVDVMRPLPKGVTSHIVQVFGGFGRANSQVYATRLTERLAQLASAQALFLLAPGVVSSPEMHEMMMRDPSCLNVFAYYGKLSMILMGIGSLSPSRLLQESGNAIDSQDMEELRDRGAVGDVCLRFFDREGRLIDSSFNRRLLGISADQIRSTPRRVAVAGGKRKVEAIRAALRGKWVTTLITDLDVAQALL
jgi:DNA-binding transcriptional regulator LsrR (DeoR family)